MKTWILILKGFGYIWVAAVGLYIFVGIAEIWMKEGITAAVIPLLSAYNLVNWLLTIIALAPGIGALMWANKLNVRFRCEADEVSC